MVLLLQELSKVRYGRTAWPWDFFVFQNNQADDYILAAVHIAKRPFICILLYRCRGRKCLERFQDILLDIYLRKSRPVIDIMHLIKILLRRNRVSKQDTLFGYE